MLRSCQVRQKLATVAPVIRSALLSVTVSTLLIACGGAPKDAASGDAKAKAAAQPEKPADGPEAKAEKPAEKHFDLSHDKSGVLARSAAVLETEEGIDLASLHELSHHAEKMPKVEDVCRHMAKIRKASDDISTCVKETEHHIVVLGPELYGEVAECMLESKTPADIDACEKAEKEIEVFLHEKPHGDKLSKEVCDKLFDHFEKLAMEEAEAEAEHVKEVLEEVRADIVVACMEQGRQSEVDCAMKTEKMSDIKSCSSLL